jgi:predicted RNase H-like nuclease
LPKIREVDELLQTRPKLREVVREIHPEVSFSALVGTPMTHRKATLLGREERQRALARSFPELHVIEKHGRDQGLPIEDILDATVGCWSALRLVGGKGRSLPDVIPLDSTGLPMAIWV